MDTRLTVEERARAAAADARAAAIDRIFLTLPPDSRHVKLISDVNLHEGFKRGIHVVLEKRKEIHRNSNGIQRELRPTDWMYKIRRYIIRPNYRVVYSPRSGREVIPASSLSLDNQGRQRMRVEPLSPDMNRGIQVFLLKEARWTGRGGIPVVVPRGATGQIVSQASRVGSETTSRTNPAFCVLFWKKFFVVDLFPCDNYVEWGNMSPLAQGERPNIPTVPGEGWASEYPAPSQVLPPA